MEVLNLDESFEESGEGPLSGLTFVITGKVEHFENRDEVKKRIISEGGKAAASVSGKTDYLINNNPDSSSSKIKKPRSWACQLSRKRNF